jgi:hypothetical protein
MFCSPLLLDVRFGCSGHCLSFFLDFGSRLALISQKRTFFDSARLVHVTPSWRETWKELFHHVPSELLSGELLGVVLVLCWDAKLL